MLFGMWARVGPSNHVLDEGPDLLREGAILRVVNMINKSMRNFIGILRSLVKVLPH